MVEVLELVDCHNYGVVIVMDKDFVWSVMGMDVR